MHHVVRPTHVEDGRPRATATSTSNTSKTKFGYTGAAGLSFEVGPKSSFYAEGRWLGSSGTNVVPVLVGVILNF